MAEVFGMDIEALPPDYYPTGVILMIRGIDTSDGRPFMAIRSSSGVAMHEVLGMSWVMYEDAKRQVREGLEEGC